MTATRSTPGSGAKDVTVAEAMYPGVFTCPPETPLETVAAIMAERRIHCVFVLGAAAERELPDGPWGVISDLDLVASVADLDTRTARSAAATPVVMIAPHEPLRRAAQLMSEYGTAHLVVIDPATARPVGVISTLDVARMLARREKPEPDYDEPVLVHEP
jgi:CBS domain-containing protein